MFKKSFITAAVALCLSAGAHAALTINTNTGTTPTNVGKQSTQTVLQFQKAGQANKFRATLGAIGELPGSAFVRLENTGTAKWNLADIKAALGNTNGGNLVKYIDGDEKARDTYAASYTYIINTTATPAAGTVNTAVVYAATVTVDNGDGTDGNADDELFHIVVAGTNTVVSQTYAQLKAVAASTHTIPGTSIKVDVSAEVTGTPDVLTLTLHDAAIAANGTGAVDPDTGNWTIDNDGTVLRVPVTNAATFAGVLDVDLKAVTGLFDLRSAAGDIKVGIGVQELAGSFSAEPVDTQNVFSLVDVLKLDFTANCNTANVSTRFMSLNDTGTTDTNPTRVCGTGTAKFDIENQTTTQNVLADKIKLKLTGDFTNVETITEAGDTSAWTVAADKKSAEATVDVQVDGLATKSALIPTFKYKANTVIAAQKFKLNLTLDASSTFDKTEFTDGGDLIIIEHDGFSFNTVTTGTSSSNTIFIRDVSNNLPAAGGMINVTITEYDDAGKGTVFGPKALSTKLPSNGAVTLTPAGIATDLGFTLTPGKQARFSFEVETEKGEAAVKKQVTGIGIDIQTGSNADTDATL